MMMMMMIVIIIIVIIIIIMKVQVAEISEAQKIPRVHVQTVFLFSNACPNDARLTKKNVYVPQRHPPDPNNVRQEAGAIQDNLRLAGQ